MRHERCTPLKGTLTQRVEFQSDSWWVGAPPVGFQALAAAKVIPLREKPPTIYKWRENNFD